MYYSPSWHHLREQALKLTIAVYRVTDYFPKAEILRNHLRVKANEIFERLTEYAGAAADSDEDINALIGRIHTINGYLAIAHTLDYVRPVNFTILEREYTLIEQFLEAEKSGMVRERTREGENHLGLASSSTLSIPGAFAHRKEMPRGKDAGEHSLTEKKPDVGVKDRREEPETQTPAKGFYTKGEGLLHERHTIIVNHIRKSGRARISDLYGFFPNVSSKTIQRDLQYLVDRHKLKKEGEKRWTVYSVIGA